MLLHLFTLNFCCCWSLPWMRNLFQTSHAFLGHGDRVTDQDAKGIKQHEWGDITPSWPGVWYGERRAASGSRHSPSPQEFLWHLNLKNIIYDVVTTRRQTDLLYLRGLQEKGRRVQPHQHPVYIDLFNNTSVNDIIAFILAYNRFCTFFILATKFWF